MREIASVQGKVVERLGLFTRLRKALRDGVACVAAPAGYGKTTFVRSWLGFEPQTHRPLWLTVGVDDDEPAPFYRKLCAACAGGRWEEPASFAAAPTEHTRRLLREVAEAERADIVSAPRRFLVIDDVHLLTHTELLRGLPEVIRSLPDGCGTILIGRGGPLFRHIAEAFHASLSLSRIGANELRFSSSEIAHCFELHGRKISRAEAVGVYRHTGGWPIAAALLAGRRALPRANGRDKLLERTLRQAFWNDCPPRVRTFLLKTCVADELTPALSARLTGRDAADASNMLEEVSRTSLLTRAAGDSGPDEPKYLHHDLFLEFLRARLAERPEIDRAALHAAAAEHYFDADDAYRAIRHALLSGELGEFGESSESGIVTRAMHEAVRYDARNNSIATHVGRIRETLVGRLSEAALARYPYLHATLAWYFHLTGDAKRAEAEFDRLYAVMPEIAEHHGAFLEMAVLVYPLDHRYPGGNFFVRVAPEMRKKLGRRRLQFPGMGKNLPFAHKGAKDVLDFPGMPEHTEQFERAAPLFGDNATVLTNAIRSGLWLERDDTQRALACAREAEAALPADAVPDMVFSSMMAVAAALDALERPEEAEVQREKVRLRLEEMGALYLLPNFRAYEAKLRLSDGDASAADEWLASYFVRQKPQQLELFRIFQHLTTARALMVRAPLLEARNFLERLARLAGDFRRTTDRAEARALLAVLEWHRGIRNRAAALLEEAVRALYPYRCIRVFADEGAALLPVLNALEKRLTGKKGKKRPETEPLPVMEAELSQHVRRIRLAAYARSRKHKGLAWAMEPVPAALSPQQIRMLSLLAEGYSRLEAETALGIQPGSFRTQMQRACRKLETDSIDEALVRAMEQGII